MMLNRSHLSLLSKLLIEVWIVSSFDNRHFKRLIMLFWATALVLTWNCQWVIFFLDDCSILNSLNWILGIAEGEDRGVHLLSHGMIKNLILLFFHLLRLRICSLFLGYLLERGNILLCELNLGDGACHCFQNLFFLLFLLRRLFDLTMTRYLFTWW